MRNNLKEIPVEYIEKLKRDVEKTSAYKFSKIINIAFPIVKRIASGEQLNAMEPTLEILKNYYENNNDTAEETWVDKEIEKKERKKTYSGKTIDIVLKNTGIKIQFPLEYKLEMITGLFSEEINSLIKKAEAINDREV